MLLEHHSSSEVLICLMPNSAYDKTYNSMTAIKITHCNTYFTWFQGDSHSLHDPSHPTQPISEWQTKATLHHQSHRMPHPAYPGSSLSPTPAQMSPRDHWWPWSTTPSGCRGVSWEGSHSLPWPQSRWRTLPVPGWHPTASKPCTAICWGRSFIHSPVLLPIPQITISK